MNKPKIRPQMMGSLNLWLFLCQQYSTVEWRLFGTSKQVLEKNLNYQPDRRDRNVPPIGSTAFFGLLAEAQNLFSNLLSIFSYFMDTMLPVFVDL